MRLDAYLARCTPLSRKEARRAVMAGRVSVDGHAVTKAAHQVSQNALVMIDGQPLSLPGPVYLMLNKPAGLLSATTDASQPVVNDLLPDGLAVRVHPAGRL